MTVQKFPINVLRKSDNETLQGFIHIHFVHRLNEHGRDGTIREEDDVSAFFLAVDGQKFYADNPSPCFELSLMEIERKMKPEYCMKCCFTCQYADYSPYGSDDFGSMLCYREHKTEYLKVNNKDDYFKYLSALTCEYRQETYFCEDYEPRVKCAGYRGFLK